MPQGARSRLPFKRNVPSADVTRMEYVSRCPACSSLVRPGQDWCTLCHADLRPPQLEVAELPASAEAVVAAVAGWGVAIVAFGLLAASFPLALVCLAVAGGADVVSAVLRSSIVQLTTPDHLRGRLSSIHMLVVTSGPRVGDAEAAAVAAVAGPQFSVVSGGLMCLVGLVFVVRLFPQLLAYEHDHSDRNSAFVAAVDPGNDPAIGPHLPVG